MVNEKHSVETRIKNFVSVINVYNENIVEDVPILYCVELSEREDGRKELKATASHLHSSLPHIEALYPKQDLKVDEFLNEQLSILDKMEDFIGSLSVEDINSFILDSGKVGFKSILEGGR